MFDTSFDEMVKTRARAEKGPAPEGFEGRLDAVLEALPEREQHTRPVRRHMGRKVVAVAAAACLLAGLGTSLAVASSQTVDPLSARLETWVDDGLATPVGVSDSCLGWTVTVDSVLGDSWYAYILCTLSRDDGAAIQPGDYGFHDWDFGFPDGLSHTSGIHWLEDGDQTDNRVPFSFHLSNYNTWDLRASTPRLTLDGLNTADLTETWGLLLSGGGKWELEFTLPAQGAAEDFAPTLPCFIEGKEAVLDTVRVSPMEVWAEYSSAEGAFAGLNPTLEDYDPEWALSQTPRFVLSDGAELCADGSAGGTGDGSVWYSAYRTPEGRTLAAEDIVGIQIGERVYPLDLR